MEVLEVIVKGAAGKLPKNTRVKAARLAPLMVTEAPPPAGARTRRLTPPRTRKRLLFETARRRVGPTRASSVCWPEDQQRRGIQPPASHDPFSPSPNSPTSERVAPHNHRPR